MNETKNETKPTALKAKVYQKIYWGDFLKDTMQLHGSEKGAYLLLIGCYFLSRRALPDDDSRLALITGLLPDEWRRVRPAIEPFFQVREGRWHHKRIEADILQADAEFQAKQHNARATNAKRYAQRHAERDAERPKSESEAPVPCARCLQSAAELGPEEETFARVKELVGEDAYHENKRLWPRILHYCPGCLADALTIVEHEKKQTTNGRPEAQPKESWAHNLVDTCKQLRAHRHGE
jgi:uncharacterized protein YdaU (DUF1376 family)